MIPFILILGLLLVVLQMFLPEFHFMHARPYLLPILVAYSALRFPITQAVAVAASLGVFLDLFSFGKLGLSSLGFILMTLFIVSQTENFKFDYLPHTLLLTLLGIFLYLVIDYLFFCLEVQTWRWPARIWVEIANQSFFDTVLALPIYLFFNAVNRWCIANRVDRQRPSRR